LAAGAAHFIVGVRYPEDRHALYFIPLTILVVGTMAAWSSQRRLRVVLVCMLLTVAAVGSHGLNLSHTQTWRECADIPSALLAAQEIHQRTGEHVTLAHSGSKWTLWYYAEHTLGLHLQPSMGDMSYMRTYDWLTVYEWLTYRKNPGFVLDQPLLPGTTYLLLTREDELLLAGRVAGGFTLVQSYPGSNTALYKVNVPVYHGTYTWRDGKKYEGEFKNGRPNGRGIYTSPDGQKYVGEFKDGRIRGQGTHIWPNGCQYSGEFNDGVANGQGTYTWPDGRKYVGGFNDGKPSGQGTLTSPDGHKYVGGFKDGNFDGQGSTTWPDGRKYVGAFRDGKPNGLGTATWPDGRKYEGGFRDGQPDGAGKMTYPDGRIESGLWRQGQFQGARR
ncbi:MAG TPA: hypothetical protein VL486_03425, partial [Verrucomicrobiae bacterium]|nr:hypothetical protein [Verrucomicrobiae bacterium]